ncbi:MAG: protein phosphatase 2C domain-containing protein [bacterium]
MEKKWIYSYGELVGKSHAPRNVPCQDKALCREENDVYVAVVSDGCGSSDISQYGSSVTAEKLCDIFVNNFDELYNMEIFQTRKYIVDEIALALNKFIFQNPRIFADYKDKYKDKYERFITSRTENEFELDALNATALFVAVKDGKYMMGAIGDGIIGAVVDNKIKIVIEEKKTDEVNGTIYPGNIYTLAKEDERWYATTKFQFKKPQNANIQGFILMSDGVDGLIDQRVAFQKKFSAGVGKLIKNTIRSENFEDAQKSLNEELLPRLVEFSKARDDCSIALLINDDCEIDENGYVVTYYERPLSQEMSNDEIFDEGFRDTYLDKLSFKIKDEVLEEKENENEYEKLNNKALNNIRMRIDAQDADNFYSKVKMYFRTQPKSAVNELLEFYLKLLNEIDENDIFFYDNENEYKNLTYLYQFDDKLVKTADKGVRRDENEKKAND